MKRDPVGLRAVILGCFFAAVQAPHALSRQVEDRIVVRVHEAPITTSQTASAARYLNGYRSSISGQTIDYHSSDPDVDSALLVRGQTIAPSIAWETDPMPETQSPAGR